MQRAKPFDTLPEHDAPTKESVWRDARHKGCKLKEESLPKHQQTAKKEPSRHTTQRFNQRSPAACNVLLPLAQPRAAHSTQETHKAAAAASCRAGQRRLARAAQSPTMSMTPSSRSLVTSTSLLSMPECSASAARLPILRLECARRPRTMCDCERGISTRGGGQRGRGVRGGGGEVAWGLANSISRQSDYQLVHHCCGCLLEKKTKPLFNHPEPHPPPCRVTRA